jgi:uncharacterized protein YdeI (YjbR/CyaY-like superfamily)
VPRDRVCRVACQPSCGDANTTSRPRRVRTNGFGNGSLGRPASAGSRPPCSLFCQTHTQPASARYPESDVNLIMAAALKTLEMRNRRAWRSWLTKHHKTSPGVWLVFHKAHTGIKSMPYEDTVREALCFGWVDSLIKRLDDDRFAFKVTPRRPTSKWSDINRKRWAELKAAGQLTAAGLAAAPTSHTYAPKPVIPELPAYIAKALKANVKAWKFFQTLSRTNRRNFVVWIHIAKRPETRERRIQESIALLEKGKKLGLK